MINKWICYIGDFSFNFNANENADLKFISRSFKTAAKRKEIDILEKSINEFGFVESKCPFCGSRSKYVISETISYDERRIEVIGVSLETNSAGWENKHCKRGSKKCIGGKLNPNSVEYISRSFSVLPDEALSYIHKRNKTPFYPNNHESHDSYIKSQSRGIGYFIEKYGEEEGLERYEKFSQNAKLKSSYDYLEKTHGKEFADRVSKEKGICNLERFIEVYGKDLGHAEFEKYKKSVGLNKKDFIDRHGEEKFAHIQKEKVRKKSLSYLIEKYGEKVGTEKFISLRDSYSFTKEKYIQKHGEEKWVERVSKFQGKKYSGEAEHFFQRVVRRLAENSIDIQAKKSGEEEYFLWDPTYKRIYFYDLYLEIFGKKILMEYDTPFCHPNKEYMSDVEFKNWKFPFDSDITPENKYQYDLRKKHFAKERGYILLEVYNKDIKNVFRNPDSIETLVEETYKRLENILK